MGRIPSEDEKIQSQVNQDPVKSQGSEVPVFALFGLYVLKTFLKIEGFCHKITYKNMG